MVSTDSEEYARIAREWGARVPFFRNEELSSDTASSWDVIRDVLLNYKENGEEFDTVALLQPTSPIRTCEDIIKGYNKMEEKDANAIIAVCEMDHSPLWANILPEDNSMVNFIKPEFVRMPRQDIPTYYRINGALYIIKVEYLFRYSNIYSKKSYAIVMEKEKSIDIDDKMDFKIAEVLIKDIDS